MLYAGGHEHLALGLLGGRRRTPKGRIGETVAAIERVLADNPDHAGATHLYIHLTEASTTPERAEPYANRLAALMPAAGHIVHMPSHAYYRVGRFQDSARRQQRRRSRPTRPISPRRGPGLLPVRLLSAQRPLRAWSSALMAGDADSAVENRAARRQGPGRGRGSGRLVPGDHAGALLRPCPFSRPGHHPDVGDPGDPFP